MSFREKSAWIALVSYLVVYGYYFWRLFGAIAAGETETFEYGWLLVRSIFLLVTIEVVLTVLIAVFRPKEAVAKRDERDRIIDLKATQIAFGMVMLGALAVCVAITYGAPAIYTANGLFLSIVAAEVFKNIGQIVQYRRDA